MGVKALRKIQLGAETVAGTPVAATTIWRGVGTGEDLREVVHAEEDVGILMGVDRTFVPKLQAQINFDESPATYEQVCYVLEAGVESEAPTQDGAGSDYIRTYNFPTTAQRTPRTYTIEYGDDVQAEEADYCLVTEFNLSGEAGGPVNLTATWAGRQNATTTYTGSLSIPTVEEILFQKGKIFIGATTTFPATAQVTATWKGFSLDVTTGYTPQWYGDNTLYFTNVKQIMPEVKLELTFEHNASSVAEIAAWRAQTARAVRLDFTGNAVTSAGTTYSTKRFIIDLVGKYEVIGPFDDQDGDNVVTATLIGRYDATAASSGRFIVVNELATLT